MPLNLDIFSKLHIHIYTTEKTSQVLGNSKDIVDSHIAGILIRPVVVQVPGDFLLCVNRASAVLTVSSLELTL